MLIKPLQAVVDLLLEMLLGHIHLLPHLLQILLVEIMRVQQLVYYFNSLLELFVGDEVLLGVVGVHDRGGILGARARTEEGREFTLLVLADPGGLRIAN